ncbi:MAG: carboxypeptidase [Verrucomicrobia bacterium]|nr:MAG: carboxypeptidase [Verrucomicrobiota bacterium]
MTLNPTNLTYTKLTSHLKEAFYLKSSLSLLQWDTQVNLPSNSNEIRASQLAALSEVIHKKLTDPVIGKYLDELESNKEALSFEEQVVIRETRRDYDHNTKLPAEFVAKKTAAQSLSYQAWVEARETSNFQKFLPHLQKQLDFALQEADIVKSHKNPYDYCIDQFDPNINVAFIEKHFTELKKELVPLFTKIINSPIKSDHTLLKNFPVDKQEEFAREVIEKLGFDFTRGRLDRSVHPFCGGNPLDLRITTRYDENTPLDSLTGSIHETGHALYEQGLPKDHIGTPLSEAIGMAVHESQSRFWENQIGRSHAFWTFWESRYRELFKDQLKDIDSNLLYLTINAVGLNPIRVDSDELSYNLHIILRFELEKQLFDGSLKVSDLPEKWNASSKEILGLTPKNDKEGVLQDMHWSVGAFGYFPSYCLGNMIAAQLWFTIKKAIPDLENSIGQGNFAPLLNWLRTNIHQYGKQYNTHDLVQKITSEPLNSKYLIQYLSQKYTPLYLS